MTLKVTLKWEKRFFRAEVTRRWLRRYGGAELLTMINIVGRRGISEETMRRLIASGKAMEISEEVALRLMKSITSPTSAAPPKRRPSNRVRSGRVGVELGELREQITMLAKRRGTTQQALLSDWISKGLAEEMTRWPPKEGE